MIDIEPIIITRVCGAVKAVDKSATVTGVALDTYPSFPTVVVSEDSNITYEKSLDSDKIENHAVLLYTVSVYTNDRKNKKQAAKKLMAAVDGVMEELLLTRIMCQPVRNADPMVYRMVARYRAIVSAPEKIDGKIVYQIYKKQ